jgi:hypothetical protein
MMLNNVGLGKIVKKNNIFKSVIARNQTREDYLKKRKFCEKELRLKSGKLTFSPIFSLGL